MCNKFLDEAFRVDWKRALRIPADHRPPPYRSTALHKWYNADVIDANGYGRRQDGNTVFRRRQVDERVRRAAFQEHTRRHMRGLTRGIEPDARSEFMTKQQQGLVRKEADFDQAVSP